MQKEYVLKMDGAEITRMTNYKDIIEYLVALDGDFHQVEILAIQNNADELDYITSWTKNAATSTHIRG